MKVFSFALVGLIVGFAIGFLSGITAITQFSGNTHDLSLEAEMTSFFFFGPVGAVIGLIAGVIWAKRR